jgi:hypothetical protein
VVFVHHNSSVSTNLVENTMHLRRTKLIRTACRLAGAVFAAALVLTGSYGMTQPAAADDVLVYGPETCVQGYVWREAFEGDTVCVPPGFRSQMFADNRDADLRHERGSRNCISGYEWRLARPSDLVCVKQEIRSQVADQNRQPDAHKLAFAPGTHTVELGVARTLPHVRLRVFQCTVVPRKSDKLLAGWQQYEQDGDPCFSETTDLAVKFDTSLLGRIQDEMITRAVLTYDERPATACFQELGGSSCWTSGSRQPENKPNGCIVVRIPSTDWTAAAPTGDFPYLAHPTGRPTVRRLDVRSWDVTEPFRWQEQVGAMPLQPPTGPALSKGFGYLLTGGLTTGQLDAEDNTSCLSELSKIRLRMTYTISEGKFIPPR